MPNMRISSPSQSEGMQQTPRKHKPRSRFSVESPARSTSLRVTAMVQRSKRKSRKSFSLSPMQSRLSVLSDNTQIEEPRRRSWWRKLDENTADVIDVLSNKKKASGSDAGIDELMAVDVLSQQSNNYSTDIPESSGSDSIRTIIITRRELFTQKDQPQKKFDQIIGPRKLLSDRFNHSSATSTTIEDKTIHVHHKNLFNHRHRKRNKPSIPSALLKVSLDKTVVNKTKEINVVEVEAPGKNLFGNRKVKRKNMFENFDFAMSESEMETTEIQPKVFGFKMRREESHGRDLRDVSPSSSITTDMEMDEWKLLPSSTMVEHQLLTEFKSPAKRPKVSRSSSSRVSRTVDNLVEELQEDDIREPYSCKEVIATCASNIVVDSIGASNIVHGNLVEEVNKNNFDERKEKPESGCTEIMETSGTLNIVQDNLGEKSQKDNGNKSKELKPGETKEVTVISDVTNVVNTNLVQKLLEDNADVNEELKSNNKKKMSETSRASILVQHYNNNINNTEEECLNASKSKFDQDEIDRSSSTIKQKRGKSKESDTKIQKQNDYDIIEGNKLKNSEEKLGSPEQSVTQDEKNQKGTTAGDDHDENVEVERLRKVDVEEQPIQSIEQDRHAKENLNKTDESEKKREVTKTSEHESLNAENSDDEIENQYEEDLQNENDSEIEEEDNEVETDDSDNHEDVGDKSSEAENEELMDQLNLSIEQNEDIEEREMEDKNQGGTDAENSNKEIKNRCEVYMQDVNNSKIGNDDKVENDDSDDHGNKYEDEKSEAEDEEKMDQSNQSIALNEDVEECDEIEEEANQEVINESEHESIDAVNSNEEIENQFEDDIHDEINSENEKEDSKVETDNSDVESSEAEMDYSNQSIEQSEDVEEHDEMEELENQEMANEGEHESHDKTNDEIEEEFNDSQNLAKAGSGDEIMENNESDNEKINEPEAILRDMTNVKHSFLAQRRNTSVRKTKSIIRNINAEPSLAPVRDSIGILSDGTRNSSAEGSGWDSHRTTRKTLRQTFGKDFTLRKSLRTLVMEKSAKRQTQALNEKTADFSKFPQANSTEFPQEDLEVEESDHEMSRKMRQTTIEMYLQKIKMQNIEKSKEIEERVQKVFEQGIQRQPRDILNKIVLQASSKPIFTKTIKKSGQMKPKSKKITFDEHFNLPKEFLNDVNYKPPKRFNPSNASWITKRLYNFLETKLEPRYQYKARVRAERLVETIYEFTKLVRRHEVAPPAAVDDLKVEMARLDILKTHFEFYTFFHEFMPREIRRKVNPDSVNRIPKPWSIFDTIIPENSV